MMLWDFCSVWVFSTSHMVSLQECLFSFLREEELFTDSMISLITQTTRVLIGHCSLVIWICRRFIPSMNCLGPSSPLVVTTYGLFSSSKRPVCEYHLWLPKMAGGFKIVKSCCFQDLFKSDYTFEGHTNPQRRTQRDFFWLIRLW